MQNFISTFSPSKSFPFVNEQLFWEQGSPHCHDCHDPPHAARVGFHDDRSPPRRLPWVARPDLWNNSRGENYLLRDRQGKDCDPEEEYCALAALGAAKIELEAFAFTHGPMSYFRSHRGLYAGLIESRCKWHAWTEHFSVSREEFSSWEFSVADNALSEDPRRSRLRGSNKNLSFQLAQRFGPDEALPAPLPGTSTAACCYTRSLQGLFILFSRYLKVGERGLWQSHGQISYSLRGCFLVQVALASLRTNAITISWSFAFRFLKVSMTLVSRVSGAALLSAGIAFGSLSPSRNSWYVSISRAFAIFSRVLMLGIVCPFSTLEI
jgi:hypothetical protein